MKSFREYGTMCQRLLKEQNGLNIEKNKMFHENGNFFRAEVGKKEKNKKHLFLFQITTFGCWESSLNKI
jgi:hypothetical protein